MDKKWQRTEKGKRTEHTYKERGTRVKKRIKFKKEDQRIDERKKKRE